MNENKRDTRSYTEGKFATMLNKVHNDNSDLRLGVDKSMKDLSTSLTIEVSDSSKELTKYWRTALHNLNETMYSHKSEHITKLSENMDKLKTNIDDHEKSATDKLAKSMSAVSTVVTKTGSEVSDHVRKIVFDQIARSEESRRDESEVHANLMKNAMSEQNTILKRIRIELESNLDLTVKEIAAFSNTLDKNSRNLIKDVKVQVKNFTQKIEAIEKNNTKKITRLISNENGVKHSVFTKIADLKTFVSSQGLLAKRYNEKSTTAMETRKQELIDAITRVGYNW